jgi:hypothetical protein
MPLPQTKCSGEGIGEGIVPFLNGTFREKKNRLLDTWTVAARVGEENQ